MGLFVAEDGQFQGWLAAFLCCFAAVTEDESPAEQRRAKALAQADTCNEQPVPSTSLPLITSILTLNAFKGEEPTVDGTRQVLSRPQQPPHLSPLDLGELSLAQTWPEDPYSKPYLPENHGLTISAPLSVRRLEHTDSQKQALIPLRLGPVVLRDLPTIDNLPVSVETPVRSTEGSPDAKIKQSRHAQDPPSTAQVSQSDKLLQYTSHSAPVQQVTSLRVSGVDQPASSRPPLSTRSSTGSLHHSVLETPTSSIKSRSSSERQRPRRKRSLPLLHKDGSGRLDQEILELNTIVEERRAEAARDNLSEQHIAAVAPAMQIDARSETLSAIGSVLSRPLNAQNAQQDIRPLDTTPTPKSRIQRSISTDSWSNARFSGWLSGILPSSSPPPLASNETFYKCQTPIPTPLRRTGSEISMCTSLADMDSPSLTAASSPTSKGRSSKGHSRNLTDESRMTPVSPITPGTSGRSRGASTVKEEQRPLTPTSEVGLAL